MKEQEKLNDDPCAPDAHETLCNTHQQPLVDCANQRLRYVKAAREMDARSTASARAWEKIANEKIAERNRYKAILDATATTGRAVIEAINVLVATRDGPIPDEAKRDT